MENVKREYDLYLSLDGKTVTRMRRCLGLTMKELADICHLTRQTVFAVENDHKQQTSAFHVQDSTKLLVVMTLVKIANDGSNHVER